MGNGAGHQSSKSCRENVGSMIQQTRIQLSRINPFSRAAQQVPYASPIQENIYALPQQVEAKIKQITEKQPIKRPRIFLEEQEFQYFDQYWKKQNPNVVIQGHWYQRVPHGLCTVYFPGGSKIFIGYFNHGVPLYEDCLVIFDDLAYYHGQLRDWKFHNLGKYVSKDIQYDGEWQNGIPVGKGKEKIIGERQIITYEGGFGSRGQKQGKQSAYKIINRQNHDDVVLEYKGQFKDDSIIGQCEIKLQNGKNLLKGKIQQETILVRSLITPQFQYSGELDRNFNSGKGKFKSVLTNDKNTYEGEIRNGILHGPGMVVADDGTSQQVYWFQGIKLKLLRNWTDEAKLRHILEEIQLFYQEAKSFPEMAKKLTDHINEYHPSQKQISPRQSPQKFLFEMISKQKLKKMLQTSKISASTTRGGGNMELVVELDNEKYLCARSYTKSQIEGKDE